MALTTTAQAWKDRILAWQGSGLTQKEFCKKHGIKVGQFWNWKSRFNKQGLTKRRGRSTASTFVSVAVVESGGQSRLAPGAAGFTLVFEDFRVIVEPAFDPVALAKLLEVLRK